MTSATEGLGFDLGPNSSISDVSEEPNDIAPGTYTDNAGFSDGIVEGFVTCGDPFVDGFAYDPQIVRVQLQTGGTAPLPLPDTPPGTPPPANAVPGNPTFTG